MHPILSKIASVLVPSVVRRRYSAKFVVSILFVVLVIAAVGTAGYVLVNDTIERDTQANLESSAEQQAETMTEWTTARQLQTDMVRQSEAVREGDEDEVAAEIQRRIGPSHDVYAYHVIDLESETLVASTASGLFDQGQSLLGIDQPWANADLEEVLDDDEIWRSERAYRLPGAGDDRAIGFAARVPDSNRVVVTDGTFNIRGLESVEGSQTTSFVQPDGTYVLRPFHEEDGPDRIEDSERLSTVQSVAETGESQFTTDGDTVRAYHVVDQTDWIAVTSVSAGEAFAVRDTVGATVLLIVASGLVALGFVGVVLGRQTVVPLERLQKKTRRIEEGEANVDFETGRIDEIGRLYDAFGSMHRSLLGQMREAERAREEAELAREEAERLNRSLERSAEEYRSVMESAAAGDLTVEMDADNENEAMADIAGSFNEMLGEIEATVEHLKRFAVEVATASEQVTGSSEEVRGAGEQVSEAIQEISDGANRQNESLQSVRREMTSLASTTEEIASSSNQVADLAERTAATGREGRKAAQQAIEGMNAIEDESAGAVDEIEALQEEVAQIDELLEFIAEVADQTNMLALNANIEASRSSGGDASGGFGAIAGEVKELSAETKAAAQDIEARLERIKDQTDRTANEVQRTSSEIATHTDSVRDAADALEEIADNAQETNTGVQEISAATQQQAASTQEVVAQVEKATAISEETTARAESVAAAAEEQTSALSEVSSSASDLSLQASQLSAALDRFETAVDAEAVANGTDGERGDEVEAGEVFSFGPEGGADTGHPDDSSGD